MYIYNNTDFLNKFKINKIIILQINKNKIMTIKHREQQQFNIKRGDDCEKIKTEAKK